MLHASRCPPRPSRKQRGPTNCWWQFTAAHRRTERLKGWDERQKQKRRGREKTGRRRKETRQKKTIKVESRIEISSLIPGRKSQQMGLCFVSRALGLQRIKGCRSQPVQARNKKNKNGGKAEAFAFPPFLAQAHVFSFGFLSNSSF